LIRLLKLKAGEKVLDICGSGELTSYAAQLVKPNGFMVDVDPSPYRIQLAKRKIEKNLSFHVAGSDNSSIFSSNFFDVVYHLDYFFH
jgi:ubiquinone/menaquinone biosynthesis C-methylase UbiE